MSDHALLSPSSANRWLSCTPSARFELEFKETSTNEAAEEGSLAHALAEFKLKKLFKLDSNININTLKTNALYKQEMEDFTQDYVDYITNIIEDTTKQVFIEQRVNLDRYAPESFGTCDCVIIGGDTLHIVDFKYGVGVPVSAFENTQLKLYALGCYQKFKKLKKITKIKLHIVQPRIDNNSSFEMELEDLLVWGEYIKPIAKKAFEGVGDFKPSEGTCRFCKARQVCKARAEYNVSMFDVIDNKIKDEDIAAYIERGADISKWLDDLKNYALNKCLSGEGIKGLKAVHGRSVREWSDEGEALSILETKGIKKGELYETKPLSLAKIEKLVGKDVFNSLVGGLVVKTYGRPILANIDDKREAITKNDLKGV